MDTLHSMLTVYYSATIAVILLLTVKCIVSAINLPLMLLQECYLCCGGRRDRDD